MTRGAVHQYWRKELQTKADSLLSTSYMKTGFMSLTVTHPIFTSCASNPWETEKAVTQARLLSGRYRLESLSGHWTPGNKEGLGTLPNCWGTASSSHKGNVESFLLTCPSLAHVRTELAISNLRFLHDHPHLEDTVRQCLVSDEVQFWLDCSTMPLVISAVQGEGGKVLELLLKMTRNYCHRLHMTRKKLLSDNS